MIRLLLSLGLCLLDLAPSSKVSGVAETSLGQIPPSLLIRSM